MRYVCAIFMILLWAVSPARAEEYKTTESEHWDNGHVRISRQYDQKGNLREIKYYREDGTLEQLEKYDSEGHKTEIAYYGDDGRLYEAMNGWAALTDKYENGNLVAESYYGADGQLKERKLYNSEGDLVEKQYVGDGSIDDSERYNPEPSFAGETDEDFDEEGQLKDVVETFSE